MSLMRVEPVAEALPSWKYSEERRPRGFRNDPRARCNGHASWRPRAKPSPLASVDLPNASVGCLPAPKARQRSGLDLRAVDECVSVSYLDEEFPEPRARWHLRVPGWRVRSHRREIAVRKTPLCQELELSIDLQTNEPDMDLGCGVSTSAASAGAALLRVVSQRMV